MSRIASTYNDPESFLGACVRDGLRLRKVAVHAARSAARAVVGVIEDAVDHRGEVPRYPDDEWTLRKLRGPQVNLASRANRHG